MTSRCRSSVCAASRRVVLASLTAGVIAGLAAYTTAQQPGAPRPPDGYISGVVERSQGPEAGVWVIAETNDLPTKLIKIVVTSDDGRFMLPELPPATYDVWVRGYGLVDSTPVKAKPGGGELSLKVSLAKTPQEAAKIYPANYWFALLQPPAESEFPGTGPRGNGISPALKSQAQWIDHMKEACQYCHQIGNQHTRQTKHMPQFTSSIEAWDYRVQTGQRGNEMSGVIDGFGRTRALKMYADWTDRIATGEVPPMAPPRPRGIERNVVLTLWDWGTEKSFMHDEITTTKSNPRLNAGGPVYAVSAGAGKISVLSPSDHKVTEISIPTRDDPKTMPSRFPSSQIKPSNFWGETLLWGQGTEKADPHNPMMDRQSRLWMTSTIRGRRNPAWCQDASLNKFAQYFPVAQSARQTSFYDPKTKQFTLIDTCFGTHHLQFTEDANETVYYSGGGPVIGWVDSRVLDQTHDEKVSQGWCPTVIDTNGDGKITKPWNEPGAGRRSQEEGGGGAAQGNIDPKLDTRLDLGSYGIIVNPVDGSVWVVSTTFPSRLVRFTRGSNPPETCTTEVYQMPSDGKGRFLGYGARGIDVDRNGVIWTALSGTSHLASFDSRKCKVSKGPQSPEGQHCNEGWKLYATPSPKLKGTTVAADYEYYNWVDQFNTSGLGANTPIATGSGSDSLLALLPATGEFVTMRVPYPLGFWSRGVDGRIDDPNAGWKGRGLWAIYGSNYIWHTEGGKGTRGKVVHFQIRPDPLAR